MKGERGEMADREKMIELVKNGVACPGKRDPFGDHCEDCPYYDAKDCDFERLADYLLANGVRLETKQATSDENKRWIPVTERLPEEHDSIFTKLYGTERWMPGMVKTISDNVIAAFVLTDGRRKVKETHTSDGKWYMREVLGAKEVTHWMPLPKPPKEE